MDVFVGYTPEDEFELLKATLEAWAGCEGAEPKAIFITKKSSFEMYRRIAADRLSEEKFYIIADLGCVPISADFVREIRPKLKDEHGLVEFRAMGADVDGVIACQKEVVRQWIPDSGGKYRGEHQKSVERAGKKVEVWEEPKFTFVGAS